MKKYGFVIQTGFLDDITMMPSKEMWGLGLADDYNIVIDIKNRSTNSIRDERAEIVSDNYQELKDFWELAIEQGNERCKEALERLDKIYGVSSEKSDIVMISKDGPTGRYSGKSPKK